MAIHNLKKYFFKASCRTVAGFLLAIITITPAFAAPGDSYEILTTGDLSGSGSIDTSNNAVTFSSNADSCIGMNDFTNKTLNVQFLNVDYFDGKPENNHIEGNFAQGLEGIITSEPPPALARFEITFDPTTAPTTANPTSPVTHCSVQLFNNLGEQIDLPNCNTCEYSLTNMANATGDISVPEPSTLMLITIGLLSCWLVVHRRRRAA